MRSFLMGAYTIWLRDLLRFWRDKARIIGSIVQPILYLFILGTGLSAALGSQQAASYIRFIFPGIIAMSLLFTSIFSSISIVWDREFGFLKEVLVAPISRTAVVIGKCLGGATIATLQALMLLIFSPIVGFNITLPFLIKLIPLMFLISFSLTSFGVAIAARMRTMEGFQVIMNFILMPVFFLSGAMFPLKGLPKWLGYLTMLDPLTYGVDAMRNLFDTISNSKNLIITKTSAVPLVGRLMNTQAELFKPIYPIMLDIIVISIFGFVMITIAIKLFERNE